MFRVVSLGRHLTLGLHVKVLKRMWLACRSSEPLLGPPLTGTAGLSFRNHHQPLLLRLVTVVPVNEVEPTQVLDGVDPSLSADGGVPTPLGFPPGFLLERPDLEHHFFLL